MRLWNSYVQLGVRERKEKVVGTSMESWLSGGGGGWVGGDYSYQYLLWW